MMVVGERVVEEAIASDRSSTMPLKLHGGFIDENPSNWRKRVAWGKGF